MCTVSYIPKGKDAFILCSNRDEAPSRSGTRMESIINKKGIKIIFPKDIKAGGTWIASSEDNRILCLLNGAFQKHKHRPPYRMSRGRMLLQYFEYNSIIEFNKIFDFKEMEPFTLVIYEREKLYEMRWDETMLHLKTLDPSSYHIWSSCTLYPAEIAKKRTGVFFDWLQHYPNPGPDEILDIHLHGSVGDEENNYVMNRNNIVRTVSITRIVKSPTRIDMDYYDLINERGNEAPTRSLQLELSDPNSIEE